MSFRVRLALWIGGVVIVSTAFVVVASLGVHGRTHYNSLDLALIDDAGHYRSLVLVADDALAESPPQFQSSTSAHLYAADGSLLTRSSSSGSGPPLDAKQVIDRDDGPAYGLPWTLIPRGHEFDEGWFATVRNPESGDRIRLYVQAFDDLPGDAHYVLTWTSLARLDSSIHRFQLFMFGLGALTITMSLAGGMIAARQVLNPISTVMRTARAIAVSRGFARRVPESGEQGEMGQLARTLNEMLQSLEDAYRVQQQFVADAAHELRTPLTSIRGNIHVLSRLEKSLSQVPPEPLSDHVVAERAEALRFLESESARMSQMVDELLTLARADSGLGIERRPVDLDAVLLSVVAELSVITGGRELTVEAIEPVQISGDPLRLKQLVLIVLDNALKYTASDGTIRVSLRMQDGQAVLTVEDTGIGIAHEDLPHLFKRFYRGKEGRGHYVEGTGLGLAIARWVVDTHGGEIAITSEPGEGTAVTVRLPAR
ncbi:MAG: sensor histidine kinase [Dehalococcoidia bacterium]